MTAAITVCFIIPGFSDGGAQKQCIYLLNELQQRDDINLILIRSHAGVHDGMLERRRITVHDLPVRSNYDPRAVLRAIQILRSAKCDLIVSWLQSSDVQSYFIRLGVPGMKWLMTQRNSKFPTDLRFRLRKLLGRTADGIASNSAAGDLYWQNAALSGKRYIVSNIVQPFAVDTQVEKRAPRTVLYLGRLEPQKNVAVVVDAFCRAAERMADTTFVLVGQGSQRESLEVEVARRGMAKRVHFAGFHNEVGPFFARSDLVVSLSHHEGLPNVLMEAVSAGVPVVASRIPEHEEFLGHDYLYLVNSRTNGEAAAETIARALDDPQAGSHLRFARDRLAEMSAAAVGNSYVTIFRELIGMEGSLGATV